MRKDKVKFLAVPSNRFGNPVRLVCQEEEWKGLRLRCSKKNRYQIAAGQIVYVDDDWHNGDFLECGDNWEDLPISK